MRLTSSKVNHLDERAGQSTAIEASSSTATSTTVSSMSSDVGERCTSASLRIVERTWSEHPLTAYRLVTGSATATPTINIPALSEAKFLAMS